MVPTVADTCTSRFCALTGTFSTRDLAVRLTKLGGYPDFVPDPELAPLVRIALDPVRELLAARAALGTRERRHHHT